MMLILYKKKSTPVIFPLFLPLHLERVGVRLGQE